MTAPEPASPGKAGLVTEGILAKVSSGTWPPGSRIPGENELAALFGVSRVSVRKAVSELAGRGILTAVRGGGTYVNELRPEDCLKNALELVRMDSVDYRDIQDFRLMLEPVIAARAAYSATEEQLRQLAASVDRQEEAERQGDRERYLEEDLLFHHLLAEATGNPLVLRVMGLMQELLRIGMREAVDLTGYADGVGPHREILRYLTERDPEGAKAAVFCHIRRNIAEET